MLIDIDSLPTTIIIGRQTETGVKEFAFDCRSWVENWPGMTINVLVVRPGESQAYPAVIRNDQGIVIWEVNLVDTAVAGYGYAELIGIVNGKKKISRTIRTRIMPIKSDSVTEPPEAAKPWVDEVLAAAKRAEDAADRAENAGGSSGGSGTGGGITKETDPTVPAWAKQPTKPSYTAEEVGALPADTPIPEVPKNVSAFENDAGYLTKHQDLSAYAKKSEIPDTSAFITRAVNDLANYYTKAATYSQEEIDQKVSAIPKFSIEVVSALPAADISETTVYLVPGGAGDNLYTEYIYVSGAWEILGSQRVDLTGYATQSWTLEQLTGYQPKGDYALKSDIPDISGKLDAGKLPEAVNDALAQAKASGEFDGADGYTPQKGKDYFTSDDKTEIVNLVLAALPAAEGVSY